MKTPQISLFKCTPQPRGGTPRGKGRDAEATGMVTVVDADWDAEVAPPHMPPGLSQTHSTLTRLWVHLQWKCFPSPIRLSHLRACPPVTRWQSRCLKCTSAPRCLTQLQLQYPHLPRKYNHLVNTRTSRCQLQPRRSTVLLPKIGNRLLLSTSTMPKINGRRNATS
jgi:hypothetical protein